MYEGSGLGLSIVKGIVTLLGGEISLHSVKGEGTTLCFTIPLGTV
jgi:signal transduction histidine kinase